MEKLNELIEKIGDFSFNEYPDEIFHGILIKDNKDFIIKGSINIDLYRKLSDSYENDITGIIYGQKLTFISSYTQKSSCFYVGLTPNDVHIEIKPEKIIVGECFSHDIIIKSSSPIYKNIDNWLLYSPINANYEDPKNSDRILTFKGIKEHTIKYNNISLTFYKTFGISEAVDKIEISKPTINSFNFDTPIVINECIKHMADFRNFLAFLANYYIEFNYFDFITDNNIHCSCYMNYCEEIDLQNERFIINFSNIQNEFNTLWNNWIDFSQKSSNIVSLFYEILCDRSTRINKFLNLCQAIESYSYIYRNSESDQVRISYNTQKCTNIKQITLTHRLIDILTHTNSLFGFSSDEINKISERISGGRNYYTHYDNINKKTSYEETMIYNRYLHIVLLLIVYKIMGLSDEMLKKYIRSISFDGIKNRILKYL